MELNLTANAMVAQSLRIAGAAIAGYDYLITIPAELRFYRAQKNGITLSCASFVAIRYMSAVLIILSDYIWFTRMTQEQCDRWFMVAPVLNVIQVMISQFILSIRTWNLSRRSQRVGWFLVAFNIAMSSGEWFAELYKRAASLNSDGHQCHAQSSSPGSSVWMLYLFRLFFICVLTAISCTYMVKYRYSRETEEVWDIMESMFYGGLGYFGLLTVVNTFNMITFMTEPATQSAGATINFTFTWIMTQRLLIDLNEVGIARRRRDRDLAVFARRNPPAHTISHALRSFTSRKDADAERAGKFVDVQVRIEKTRTISVDDAAEGSRVRRTTAGAVTSSVETGSEWCESDWTSEESSVRPNGRPPMDPLMMTMRP